MSSMMSYRYDPEKNPVEVSAHVETQQGKGTASSTRFKRYIHGVLIGACFIFTGLLLLNFDALPSLCQSSAHEETVVSPNPTHLTKYAVDAAAQVLRVFQLYPPVLVPSSSGQMLTDGSPKNGSVSSSTATSGCTVTQTIMEYSFVNSYGAPFVASYSPPANCAFNRVTFNFTVTSAGRQFDRLGVAYLGDTEIWRTSTAEPTQAGIIWTYIKDMSHLVSLFKQDQKFIFDLGNNVNDIYTAPFNTTLQATFFNADDTVNAADLIVPISSNNAANNGASAFQIPSQNATSSLTLPRNVRKAVFSISATGQSDEEFWFGNVLQSDVDAFPGADLLGFSPFREAQLLIDGQLAGVAWPFPIIFTGGVVPGLWRPVVGIDAFDLREDEIDITPWLPLLCDGQSHTYELRVVGINDDGKGNGQLTKSVGNYWVVSGKVFMWLDPAGSITSGSMPQRSIAPPTISLSSSVGTLPNGTNQTLVYTVNVNRQLSISSNVISADSRRRVTWMQNLSYFNHGNFTDFGNTQDTQQDSKGTELSSNGYSRRFDFPITVNTTYNTAADGSFSINATVDRTQDIQILGQPVFPTGLQSFEAFSDMQTRSPAFQGSHLSTEQQGSAYYESSADNKAAYSFGHTEQDMTFSGVRADLAAFAAAQSPSVGGSSELYHRHVLAVNGSLVEDNEMLVGRPIGGLTTASTLGEGAWASGWAGNSVMSLLGRGPGRH